jgi:hypothetical protein
MAGGIEGAGKAEFETPHEEAVTSEKPRGGKAGGSRKGSGASEDVAGGTGGTAGPVKSGGVSEAGGGTAEMTGPSEPSAGGAGVTREGAEQSREGTGGGAGMEIGFAGEAILAFLPLVLLGLARAWLGYEKGGSSPKADAFRALQERNVEPAAKRALQEHAAEVRRLSGTSLAPVYANITVDLDLSWDEDKGLVDDSAKDIDDVRFVDLQVSRDKLSKKQGIAMSGGFGSRFQQTQRVTYSVELDLGEKPAQHRQRVYSRDAAEAARRGQSARSIAEATHWGGDLTPGEKAEDLRGQRHGRGSLAKERVRQERREWVMAYVEYTAMHGPDDQYADALRYLRELEQRDAAEKAAEEPGAAARQR